MTAFAIDLRRDRLTIASDTLAYTLDPDQARPVGFIRKVYPLHRLKAVVFGRGSLALTVAAWTRLLTEAHATIEAAAEALPGILDQLSREFAAQHRLGDYRDRMLLAFVLGGWSDQAGRIRAWYYYSHQAYRPFEDGGNTGFYPVPDLPAERTPDTRGMSEDERLVATIQAIGGAMQDNPETMAAAVVGGEVVAITVTRDGLSERMLYRFPTYDQHAVASAAVRARIMRGEHVIDVAGGIAKVTDEKAVHVINGKAGRMKPEDVAALLREQQKLEALKAAVAKLPRKERKRAEALMRQKGIAA